MSWTWLTLGLAVWLAGITAAALLAGAPRTGRKSSEQNDDDRDPAGTRGDLPRFPADAFVPALRSHYHSRPRRGWRASAHLQRSQGGHRLPARSTFSTTGPAIVIPRSKAASASVP